MLLFSTTQPFKVVMLLLPSYRWQTWVVKNILVHENPWKPSWESLRGAAECSHWVHHSGKCWESQTAPPCVSARSTAPVCLPAGAHATHQLAFLVPSLPSQAPVSFSREAIFKKCLKDRLSRAAVYSHLSWPGPRVALHTLLCIVTVIKGKIQDTTAKNKTSTALLPGFNSGLSLQVTRS